MTLGGEHPIEVSAVSRLQSLDHDRRVVRIQGHNAATGDAVSLALVLPTAQAWRLACALLDRDEMAPATIGDDLLGNAGNEG